MDATRNLIRWLLATSLRDAGVDATPQDGLRVADEIDPALPRAHPGAVRRTRGHLRGFSQSDRAGHQFTIVRNHRTDRFPVGNDRGFAVRLLEANESAGPAEEVDGARGLVADHSAL